MSAKLKQARQRKKQSVGSRSSTSPMSVTRGQLYTVAACPVDIVDLRVVTEENVVQKRAILQCFAEQALKSHAKADPRADHRLKLIQLNIINSLTRNSAILGFKTDWLVCASISPFTCTGNTIAQVPCPDNLVPTRQQLEVRHHPWVDLFPLPRMRDNLLLATSYILSPAEEQELWDDVIESSGEGDWAGFIVWGEPWDPKNWEVTTLFLQKWRWLLHGCPEVVEATNYWRRQRGESPIQGEAFITPPRL